MGQEDVLLGTICLVFSPILFGTAFVPVKFFDGADGIFVQWMMCIGQLIPAFFVLWWQYFPPIYPLAMVGGVLFAIGNCFAVLVMEGLGLTIGNLLWNASGCIVGWLLPRYGLFGLPMVVPASPTVNVIGVVVVILGASMFTLVKNAPTTSRPHPHLPEKENEKEKENGNHISTTRRMLCVIAAVFAGCMFGNIYTGTFICIKNSAEWEMPDHVSPYLFSHFMGVFVSSTLIFIVYGVFKRNMPILNPELVLPSVFGGIMYGIAMCLSFTAIENLSQVIALPIETLTPGLVSCVWGTLLFKEIKGARNFLLLGAAYVITLIGVTMIALSKIEGIF